MGESEAQALIIDRSKSAQEIETQIDRLGENFQELDQRNHIVDQDEIEFQDVEDLEKKMPELEELKGIEAPPTKKSTQKKRKKAEPSDVKLDMGGKYPFSNMMRNGLGGNLEAGAIWKSGFRNKKM